jgi:hypothetical protein
MTDILNNNHLNNRKFSMEILEKNIGNLKLYTMLLTQHLTPDFCGKYFCAPGDIYAKDDGDQEIYMHTILRYQPHLVEEEIIKYKTLFYN